MRETVRTVALVAFVLPLFSLGCHISDYPIITDDRGDYSGVIRTGHKAYIVPSGQTATIYNDGSDETFTMVYQNQYGDQNLYTHNNYDPTAAVIFMDQTYCDWQYDGCASHISWNPVQNDDIFDYRVYDDCSGARSVCIIVSYSARIGECGDGFMYPHLQTFAREFSQLQTTTWRGGQAYLIPVDSSVADVSLVASDGSRWRVPILGSNTVIATERLEYALPMTPSTRHTIQWTRQWAEDHGTRAKAEIRYGGISAEFEINLQSEGLSYNAGRF